MMVRTNATRQMELANLHVWSREVVHGLEAEAGILHQDGATNLLVEVGC